MAKNKGLTKLTEKIRDLFSGDKRIRVIVFIGIIGMIILLISSLFPSENDDGISQESITVNISTDEYSKSLEKKLGEIISNIYGAGKCEVMITLECGIETVYATEDETDSETGSDREVNKNKTQYVVISGSNTGKQALLIKEIQPKVRGVIVVCEGGDSPEVQMNIINSIMSLFDIPSTKISVQKMF